MRLTAAKFALLRVCVTLVPPRNHAVVSGSPDDEGNSVEVVRGLAPHMRVYWLVSDDPASLTWLIHDAPGVENVRCLRKNSLAAQCAYVSARFVFFTHGLYGSPKPPANKTFVNVWHGDGPKLRKNFAAIRSSVVVSGTQLWGSQRAVRFGMAPEDVIVSGNPRVDQFARPIDDESLSTLGVEPSAPFILWLPTYRATEYQGHRIGAVRDWVDADEISSSERARTLLARIADNARRDGVTLAVKPHHLDADKFADVGMHVISSSDLRSARRELYRLLGRADGLITDYSSVWTDFLVRDRPIGFYCPDIEDYTTSRGLNVDDYPSLIPGPWLETAGDFAAFVSDCIEESESSKARRARVAAEIGAETRLGATERLLSALSIIPLLDTGADAPGGRNL